jgi:hypothetical protein
MPQITDQRTEHPTKKGSGRRHGQGVKHPAAPKPAKGGDWLGQHTASAEKKLRRANVKALGRRQAVKAAKAGRREALPAGLVAEAA